MQQSENDCLTNETAVGQMPISHHYDNNGNMTKKNG